MKIFYVVFSLFSVFLLSGCATKDPVANIMHPISKIFQADYQKIWSATMLALEDYPIEAENNEKGYLKTESIPVETIWKFPVERNDTLAAAKYTLHIKMIKGKSKSRPAVKVTVLKKILLQKGFIENPKRIPSNGLEERSILYRIHREINIERAITNHHKRSSAS